MDEAVRIGNVSGFYGDRHTAMREMVEDGPIDVITGDYLAELTMLILWRGQQKDPTAGYARSFLRQLREVLVPIAERGIRVVANAGGLNPAGLADAVRALVSELGLDLRVAHVEGDDLLPRLDTLRDAGQGLTHLDDGTPFEDVGLAPLTANAYLGGFGVAAALQEGAEVVVTGRITDASLVVGPAVWRYGWDRRDLDRLAGAVVAGHVIECGAQATGGNYAFFREVPGVEHPGFPIAEVHADGSSVITKHPGTGGRVDVGTVTAQLLYEIGDPRYLNPDVVARFDTIALTEEGPDRVRISDVHGEPPTDHTKVCINTLGGFRNRATFVLTGLDVEAKADLVRRQLARALDLDALDAVDWRLVRSDHEDADDNAAAQATLTLTVHHHDAEPIGRRAFADACVGIGLASYPGFTLTAPPADAEPFGRYWPALVPSREVEEVAVLADGSRTAVAQTGTLHGLPHDAGRAPVVVERTTPPPGPTTRVPLGTLAGARSGDKGGDANVGVWVRDPAHYPWLVDLLDADGVRRLLPEAAELPVHVHPLPRLHAVNVVVEGLLGEGVASSTRPDPQAKGLGEYLRSRHVDVPTHLLTTGSDRADGERPGRRGVTGQAGGDDAAAR